MWVKLSELAGKDARLVRGALIRFKTIATYGDHYHYALAASIDADKDLCFVSLDGRSWGYGRCRPGEVARYAGTPQTISATWLFANFEAIAKPNDLDDIWVFDDALEFVLSLTEDLEAE